MVSQLVTSSFPSPRPGQPIVAAFDFDGTLSDGGSVWKFFVAICGRSTVLSASIADLAKVLKAAVVGGKASDAAKEALFIRLFKGRDADAVAKHSAEFGLEHFEARARPHVCERLRWHLAQGHLTVLVSASPELYIGPVAESLGATGFVGTRLEVDPEGKLTGRFDGPNCRGAEKQRRLAAWIAANIDSLELPFVWAYGNSAGDLEMLRSADVGVDCGKLGRFGKLNGFVRLADLPTSGGD
jgi:phosphatidylglycerophosphatase C